MTTTKQKQQEKHFAYEAAKHLGVDWFVADFENPDFIVTEGERSFGLEVNQLFLGKQTQRAGSAEKAREGHTQKLLD
ncbi:MAG: hypothetical protein Q8L54_11850, partial [Devosia sp.]|nr:hypothetical protein [Devosia sp.]